ncbi:DUF1190 domain-containing protein [Pseudovibrio ascidiaceicola]|uniref:DUF1190 domain-containing protein n=1 Tax=Pseudovibrio ascidiaceicola TaxID=285279 RepID=UPI003D36691B
MKKRSGSLKLVLMAAVGVTAVVALSDDEEQTEGRIFSNKEECSSSGRFSESECSAAFQTGSAIDSDNAPRYNTQNLCEEQHGFYGCNPAYDNSGNFSGYFVPLAAGYFIGKATSGPSDWGTRVRPVYTDKRRRELYTGDGYAVSFSNNGGSAKVAKSVTTKPPKAAKVQTRTSVVSRGGFGSRSGRSFGG